LNQAMKQRLVGTLVLGCLAIILIPLLLDGAGIQPPPLSATIPPTPEFDNTPIGEPVRPEIVADTLPAPGSDVATSEAAPAEPQPLPAFDEKEIPVVVDAATDITANTDSEPPATTPASADALEAAVAAIMAREETAAPANADSTPRLDSSGLPQAFVVRLGSFGEKPNADALVNRLLAAGYKAYGRQVTTAAGSMTAVYVGPVPTRAEANTLVGRLSTGYDLKGVVETFTSQDNR
jgi:DedD protein